MLRNPAAGFAEGPTEDPIEDDEEARMTKRYRERLEEVETAAESTAGFEVAAPVSFRWRGQRYRVLAVLGHWHEDEGWWRRGDGLPQRIERTDLWRVEARNGVPTRGVYELVRRGEQWRLDRVWD